MDQEQAEKGSRRQALDQWWHPATGSPKGRLEINLGSPPTLWNSAAPNKIKPASFVP